MSEGIRFKAKKNILTNQFLTFISNVYLHLDKIIPEAGSEGCEADNVEGGDEEDKEETGDAIDDESREGVSDSVAHLRD